VAYFFWKTAQLKILWRKGSRSIADKLRKLAEEAKRTGLAIGVGNAFPDTIDLVSQFARQAKQNGIEITPVSSIVKDPQK